MQTPHTTNLSEHSTRFQFRNQHTPVPCQPVYTEALGVLETRHRELADRNQSAADSLTDGLNETLTVHRVGGVRGAGPHEQPGAVERCNPDWA